MKNLFAPYELTVIAKEKGFDKPCLASWTELNYPINNSGNDFKKTMSLTIDCETSCDEQKVLWIDNEDAHFHWHEGSYHNGEHSRCEFGESIDAPLYQQIIDWLREDCKILIGVDHDGSNYFWFINELNTNKTIQGDFDVEYSYYEALNKAIEESFKLI